MEIIMKKRLFTLLIAAVCAGTFAGCGSSSSSSQTPAAQTEDNASENTQEADSQEDTLANTTQTTDAAAADAAGTDSAATGNEGSANIEFAESSDENMVVEPLEEETEEAKDIELSDMQIIIMQGTAGYALMWHNQNQPLENTTLSASDLTAEERGLLLYYYTYFTDDARLREDGMYHLATPDDLTAMAAGITTASTDPAADIETLTTGDYPIASYYGDAIRINATGDFGAVGEFYLYDGTYAGTENNRIKLTGTVYNGYQTPIGSFTAWYSAVKDAEMQVYPFDEVEITFN